MWFVHALQSKLFDQARNVSETGSHIRGKCLKLRIDGGVQGLHNPSHAEYLVYLFCYTLTTALRRPQVLADSTPRILAASRR